MHERRDALYHGRDKTFFFGAYQGFRYNQTQNASLTVPTAAELNGDLSALGKDIYNPFTTRPDPAKPGQYIRDIFPGRQIPKSLIDPRSSFIRLRGQLSRTAPTQWTRLR